MNKIEQRIVDHPAIRGLLLDMERGRQERELREIATDPEKHRDTCLMRDRLRWRYWEVKTGKKSAVRFCYATTPNAAGYYLTWQETRRANGSGKREYIRGHKLRREAKESALKSYERFKTEKP